MVALTALPQRKEDMAAGVGHGGPFPSEYSSAMTKGKIDTRYVVEQFRRPGPPPGLKP